MTYNLYFHPLRAYPGPFWGRSCRFWYIYAVVRGTLPFSVHRMHEKYGRIVRVAPDELAYADADAWRDIYGHRVDKVQIPKDPNFYLNTAAGELSIIAAPNRRHGEIRRLMSHGFSEKALRDQEPFIQHYVDLLIRRLRDLSVKDEPIDMVNWYNFFTFDIIGDLAFGESFNCLETSQYHPWIHIAFEIIIAGTMFRVTDYYPWVKRVLIAFIPKSLQNGVKIHIDLMKSKALNRLHMKTDRIDFMSRMADPKSGVSEKEFIASADTVLLGGSETTATLLSGVTYYLLKNPHTLEKLVHEIRSKFDSENQIDSASVNSLDYMLACLNEAFRLYPPVPGALPRRTITPETLVGKYVPPNTTVAVYQWAINHLSENFIQCEEYIPERWLGDKKFENDNRAAVQPFSVGPRNCIGRNLAYVEMRIVLARLLFNFDIEATPQIEGWPDQHIWFLWDKKPLWVKLRARDVKLRPEVAALASADEVKQAAATVY
ncbi:putative cytochrome P450 monooxygenase [Lepidopterella palustris CBS 459.81]|uniref:Putative cytochrome P450 monooxygenase n=1 Tax=Lepidopterella palustris CBS 459.81 TaxID=1314670 RepID=A0A8E2EK02_9PEZI|nr:putative cytochrome P450 monooxygenase [Lepidopterella palustris CBS 459.81]